MSASLLWWKFDPRSDYALHHAAYNIEIAFSQAFAASASFGTVKSSKVVLAIHVSWSLATHADAIGQRELRTVQVVLDQHSTGWSSTPPLVVCLSCDTCQSLSHCWQRRLLE